jgi:nitroreductase
MDVTEAIKERRSVRAFKPTPVSLNTLRDIVGQALRAPSWANTQPWEFAIVTGKQLEEIQKGFLERGEQEPTSDIARPYEFLNPICSCHGTCSSRCYKKEMELRRVQNFSIMEHQRDPLSGESFFYQAKGINAWSLKAVVLQNIMLLATTMGWNCSTGAGSCAS